MLCCVVAGLGCVVALRWVVPCRAVLCCCVTLLCFVALSVVLGCCVVLCCVVLCCVVLLRCVALRCVVVLCCAASEMHCSSSLLTCLLFAQDGPALVKKIKGIYRFNIKDAGGKEAWWIVDAKNGNGALKFKGTGRIFFLASAS